MYCDKFWGSTIKLWGKFNFCLYWSNITPALHEAQIECSLIDHLTENQYNSMKYIDALCSTELI
jgi:hypothetical protein